MSRKKIIKVRSKFEKEIVEHLISNKVKFKYEELAIEYIKKPSIYTPDIVLENGIIIELKGYFTSDDRVKHLLVREQNPKLDIRFVFQNAFNRIHKTSRTTYSDWCKKYGFKWSHKEIPSSWLK